jgi:deoxyribose-phosphate aldolase
MNNKAAYIDHTILKADAGKEQVLQVCSEAREYGFASVCVNSSRVPLCAEALKGSGVKICSVVGFPLGAMLPEAKAFEAAQAITAGADEIDMVINIGALKDRNKAYVEEDIRLVKKACGDKILKVIIETCLLSEDEKIVACQLAKMAGADFVKTSTGFSAHGATPEDVALMRKTVGPEMGVKAAGGVRSLADAEIMIRAGATRLGTSGGVAIVKGEKFETSY